MYRVLFTDAAKKKLKKFGMMVSITRATLLGAMKTDSIGTLVGRTTLLNRLATVSDLSKSNRLLWNFLTF